jgi:DNA polymerase-3 subunit alpha
MREILRKAKPQRFDDLIALNALYRPGPLRSGMIDDFIGRKQGKVEIKYEVPALAPILSDTYGVIAYQEQVMRIASDLAGFTLGQADLLRKAMGKKDADVMQAQRQKFLDGAVSRGISEKKARRIFDLIEHFAGYGFNKSHSTAYALLAYQTAYLKANYPWHFAAALLTIEAQNTDKLAMYLTECRDRGIPVLPPDVNESRHAFAVTPEGVRFGLKAVKNVGDHAIAEILASRARSGRIRSLYALCEDIDLRLVNKRVLESLIKAGAFDSLADDHAGGSSLTPPSLRPRLLAAVDSACEHGNRRQRDKGLGQEDLFGGGPDPAHGALASALGPEVPSWSQMEQLAGEKGSLGLYLSGHPIDRYADELAKLGAWTTSELGSFESSPNGPRSGEEVGVGGIVSNLRLMKTRRGDRMAVFTLEDRAGGIEVVVFPEPFTKFARLLDNGTMVMVHGKVERDEEAGRVFASEIQPLDVVREKLVREIGIRLSLPPHGRPTFRALVDVLARHRGDRRVVFELELREHQPALRVRADIAAQVRVKPSNQLVADLEQICGTGSVSLR